MVLIDCWRRIFLDKVIGDKKFNGLKMLFRNESNFFWVFGFLLFWILNKKLLWFKFYDKLRLCCRGKIEFFLKCIFLRFLFKFFLLKLFKIFLLFEVILCNCKLLFFLNIVLVFLIKFIIFLWDGEDIKLLFM